MFSFYFGLPGAGKTTLIARTVIKSSKKYNHIYCNVPMNDAPDNFVLIQNSWIGKYDISDGLLIIDEASLFADNRDYKNFTKALTSYFMLIRHYKVDVMLFAQSYNAMDKKLRTLCTDVYYMYKPLITGRLLGLTKWYRIPYGIVIPDARHNKEQTGSALGDIQEGYCKPSLIQRLFCHRMLRGRWYKYFDSWEAPPLEPLPIGDSQNT